MNDPTRAAQEAQQTQYAQGEYSGGNAMLEAQAKVGEMRGDEPVEEAIATNFSGNADGSTDANQLEKDYSPPPITQE
ncbi:hypothetical protein NIES4074_10530 [Cylindrospermum sp. NIES-4074]|nr:hypothetical protein NIES4074_10530 [Cylindrospermum sp. NIES-4074]